MEAGAYRSEANFDEVVAALYRAGANLDGWRQAFDLVDSVLHGIGLNRQTDLAGLLMGNPAYWLG